MWQRSRGRWDLELCHYNKRNNLGHVESELRWEVCISRQAIHHVFVRQLTTENTKIYIYIYYKAISSISVLLWLSLLNAHLYSSRLIYALIIVRSSALLFCASCLFICSFLLFVSKRSAMCFFPGAVESPAINSKGKREREGRGDLERIIRMHLLKRSFQSTRRIQQH